MSININQDKANKQQVESVHNKIVKTLQTLEDLCAIIKDKSDEKDYKLIIDYKNNILSICNKMCKCVSGSNTFCNDNIDSFMKCNNLQHMLLEFPILQNIIIMKSLSDKDKYDITKYIQQPYIKYELDASINYNLLDIDIDNKIPLPSYIKILSQLMNFTENVYKLQNHTNNFYNMCIHIAIFDITFKNPLFIYNNKKFRNAIINKLTEGLSIYVVKGSTRSLSMTLINKIYNRVDHDLNIYSPYFTQITNYIIACDNKHNTNTNTDTNTDDTNTNTNTNTDTNTDDTNTNTNIEPRRSKRSKLNISYKL